MFKAIGSSICAVALVAGLAACGGDGWEKMTIDGATISFEMPKPIKMNQDPKEGMVVYVAQKTNEKLSFKVGIVKRNYEQDQAKGLTDDQVLSTFAQKVLQASQQQFAQMGMKTQFNFNGSFNVEGGAGQQYQGQVGKALVLNRFYINKLGIYWVEAITQDPNNADINRFLSSFKP